MYDPEVDRLLGELERQFFELKVGLDKAHELAKQLAKPVGAWTDEDEAQYRMRNSQ